MKIYKTKSYLDETDPDILSDIIARKEFAMFKKSVDIVKFTNKLQEENDEKNIIPKFLISENIPESNYLELRSYQMLTRNYLNPNTPYSRLLLKWETGHGKTIASLSIAMNFINYYQRQDADKIGSVYIIGFTQNIFKDDLLKYPEFGFISRNELSQLNNLKKMSYSGNVNDIEKLRKFTTNLKKRLGNRKNNGFFKFIGYKELTNHLFLYSINETGEKYDLSTMGDQEIAELIQSNKLKINKELLREFSNSLIICDEIHNVYNTTEKNNWGITLQTILNHHSSCRALFLSATPLNNSPTEIIDLLNLLLPRAYYPALNKADFFDLTNKIQIIKKSKEVELGNYLKGRVSFIRDRNPKFISTKRMMGESIPGIDYLKFIRCPMSKFHYNTYKEIASKNTNTLGQDGQYLIDFLIPDPDIKNPFKSTELGLYKSKDIKNKLGNATPAWKDRMGITYNNESEIVSGNILRKNTIDIISNKYGAMINLVLKNIKEGKGKTFIYHNYIHMTGTLFIQEILLKNNIIGEFDNSSDETLCICGNKKKDHSTKENVHEFIPVRFIIVHSNLEKAQIIRSLEKYNNANNVTGSKIMILVGSRIMKESHSINSVRNIIVMSRPDNISSLIQIIGRAIRLNSHKLLPAKQRHVDISILVSSIPNKKTLSYEEIKYKEKIETFQVIQHIEKLMHMNAIDAYFNYDTIWAPHKSEEFGLDILPYKIPIQKSLTPDELNLSTFNVYHAKFEVDYYISIIKRLFIEISSVWMYKDLYAAVKNPPFSIEMNILITPDIFNIALNNILYNKSITYVEPEITEMSDELNSINLIDKIQNPDDKIIMRINDINYVITQVGELYSMVPIYNDELFIDTESIYRSLRHADGVYVDILKYLQYDSSDYINKKIRFIAKWKFTTLVDLEPSLCDFGTKFHIMFLEEIIEYMFTIWTEKNMKKNENHAFYLKMLYFYDLQRLIAWANMLDDELSAKYEKYITPVSLTLKNSDITSKGTKSKGEINQLISSLNRSGSEWISTGLIAEFDNAVHESEKLFNNVYQKTGKHTKVRADLLPVGHYLSRIPRFYFNNEWFDYTLKNTRKITENDLIIGYDSRAKTGISIKFKLRSPVQKIKNYNDTRLMERGYTCINKSKSELKKIAEMLNINIKDMPNTEDICTKIRNRLIYLELTERKKESPIKYFYNVLEHSEI
jgi:superfamily II DNA or RNA helicase